KAPSNRMGLRPYLDRMIHFWREISLAGLPCAGRAMDECWALLFESAFSLAQSEPEWALGALKKVPDETHVDALRAFAQRVRSAPITHSHLVYAFTELYAPR